MRNRLLDFLAAVLMLVALYGVLYLTTLKQIGIQESMQAQQSAGVSP